MIKIEKDLNDVPASLNGATTNQHRNTIIENGQYDKKSDDRYKQDDIKARLRDSHHGKCAFCESVSERLDIEHYRPKNSYWWLAFSWDNLLLACPTCNSEYKRTQFPINGTAAAYDSAHLPDIHTLGEQYDAAEQPQLVNPEKENPEPLLQFDRNGRISSADPRMQTTIQVCGLDRPGLNERRQKIFDIFRNGVLSIRRDPNIQNKEKISRIMALYHEFERCSQEEPTLPYLAFRRSLLAQGIITQALMQV